jgi:hypothetical protein
MIDDIKVGDLAVCIRGLEANVGRVVYVEGPVAPMDFSDLGFGLLPGWLIRSINDEPLMTVDGPRMTGYTPVGTLRRVPPLPPEQMHALDERMRTARIRQLVNNIAAILEAQEVCERMATEVAVQEARPG